jgi:outer membrane protein
MKQERIARWVLAAGAWAALVATAGAAPLGTGEAEDRAPGPAVITPDRVAAEAVAHSPKLRAVEQDVRAARARERQAFAASLPTARADASALHYESLEDVALGSGIVIPAIPDRYAAGLTVSQTLFAGGGIAQARRATRFERLSAECSLGAAQADAVLEALTAYWDWAKAWHGLEALRMAVTRMEVHDAEMRNRQTAGLATESEALATDVLLERTRLRFEDARRQEELARARIGSLTGRELPAGAAPESPAAAGAPAEEESAAAGVTNRPESRAADWAARAWGAQVRAWRAAYSPRLAVTAHYGQARPSALHFPPEDRWGEELYAGGIVTWDLFDGGLRAARVAEAAARATQAAARAQQVREAIALEIRQARIRLASAVARLAVAERAERSARRNLEAATDLWDNGLARHADVLDAQSGLTDAQYDLVAARADILLARAALDRATGRLAPPAERPDYQEGPVAVE